MRPSLEEFRSDIKYALPTLFKHEGKFVDDPRDMGGATNFGISLRFLKQYSDQSKQNFINADINKDGVIDVSDIRNMSAGQAAQFYTNEFWLRYKYFKIEFQPLATKALDLAVNMGPTMAARCFQRAVRATSGAELDDDGKLGDLSFAEINKCVPEKLMVGVKAEAASFYRHLVQYKPEYKGFLKGWLNRAYDNCTI